MNLLRVRSADDAKSILGLGPYLVRFLITKRVLAKLILRVILALKANWNSSILYIGWVGGSFRCDKRKNNADLSRKCD